MPRRPSSKQARAGWQRAIDKIGGRADLVRGLD
jgi:hypothetical protein